MAYDCSLPPPAVLDAVIDSYFERYSTASYSFLTEDSFTERFKAGVLPTHLILAVLAAGVPLSNEPYFKHHQEAAAAYAHESWLQASKEALSTPTLETVQTLYLLARLDGIAGLISCAFAKISLNVKACKTLALTTEPPSFLSFTQQEERRRIAWVVYLQDKILTGGTPRLVPEIEDDECTLQLPCYEEAYRAGEWQEMCTVGDSISRDAEDEKAPHSSTLTITIVAIYGRCVSYVRREGISDHLPPWDLESGYAYLTGLLERAGSWFSTTSVSDLEMYRDGVAFTQVEAGLALWARILLHLSHCMLNHPFFTRRYSNNPSTDFTRESLDIAAEHARQMVDLVDAQYEAGGFNGESTSYSFWLLIAGSVLSVFEFQSHSEGHFKRVLRNLERIGWPDALNMVS